MEFAIVSELFAVTLYSVVVAPILRRKIYYTFKTFNRFKGTPSSLIVDCADFELVLRC